MSNLEAPEEYWKLSESERNSCTNGCGPGFLQELSFLGKLARRIMTTDVFYESCCVHDFEYTRANVLPSEAHREEADERFLRNMKTQAGSAKPWWRRWIRIGQAYLYYSLVRKLGAEFYKQGKRHE
ncbi:MAG: hypothetical protein HYW48_09235 [Deltaproteobacteria bacterium]|nr:hypothetical protein [Deltaproteobacteria bacterium]